MFLFFSFFFLSQTDAHHFSGPFNLSEGPEIHI